MKKMTVKQYVNAVERRLNLPWDVRARVMNDFGSSIQARREAGETEEEIFAELGTPKEAAAVLNEQMREYAYRKSPWRWAGLAAGLLSGGYLMVNAILNGLLNLLFAVNANSVGVIGGQDGPTAIFVTTAPGVDWAAVLAVGVLIAGIIVWWRLGHLKQK